MELVLFEVKYFDQILLVYKFIEKAISSCEIHSSNNILLNFGSYLSSNFFMCNVPRNFINSTAFEHILLFDSFVDFFFFLIDFFLCKEEEWGFDVVDREEADESELKLVNESDELDEINDYSDELSEISFLMSV